MGSEGCRHETHFCEHRGAAVRRGAVVGDGQLLQLPARTAGGYRPMPLAAMRAAVTAIRAGQFDVDSPDHQPPTVSASAAVQSAPCSPGDLRAPAVLVLAGHPGAGASTVGLALAEALSGRWRVQLVEYCEPRRSGLGAASFDELGVDEAGWRRGRRGPVDLARLSSARDVTDCFPPPQPLTPPADGLAGDRLLVMDLGAAAATLLGELGWLATMVGSAEVVVVTRLTVPGVRQTEHLLSALRVPAALAAVGSSRWPGEVAASCGPAIRAARDAGRAVMVPIDRRLEVSGLTGEPLPKAVAAAGRSLAAHLSPDQPVLPGMSVTPLQREF